MKDPHHQREAEKYANPIASRELILKLLAKQGPLNRKEIAERLSVSGEEQAEALRRRLRAMERDGQVIRNRKNGYLPLRESELIRGRVIAHRDGFGFLANDKGGDDLFLSPKQMRSLLHGDRAVVRVVGVDRSTEARLGGRRRTTRPARHRRRARGLIADRPMLRPAHGALSHPGVG